VRDGLIKKNYTATYCGEANFKGRNFTGFIFDKDVRKTLIGFEPMNIRISK